jgi:hypothetical protein
MDEKVLFEDEAILYVLTNGASMIGLDLDARQFEESLPIDLSVKLTKQIVAVLEDPSFTALVEKIPDQQPPILPEGYGLRLRAVYTKGHPHLMAFYRVKSSWQASCLALVGLGVAIAVSSASGAIVPAAGLVLATWQSIVTLRRPDDAIQLDTYDALIKAQAALLKTTSASKDPTIRNILGAAEPGSTLDSFEKVLTGLTRLRERGVVEVSRWGKDSDDYSNPENRWRPKL